MAMVRFPVESPSLQTSLFSVIIVFIAWWFKDIIKPYSRFLYHCFLRPLGGLDDQKSALHQFYKGQAKYYDATRRGLLQGRETMLNISAAHLKALKTANPNERLVWVDVGGGTGYNVEAMDKFFPIHQFEAVYLIDLCEPLLDVARDRFAKKGWNNVFVLCQDASAFTLPTWSKGQVKPASINLATMSYSLSMIPEYHRVVDRIDAALSPDKGLLGVVDFYTASRGANVHQRAIGGTNKRCGWLSRWFWQMWFELDHIHVGPDRRSYLEYKFGTVKNYNDRNAFLIPFFVRIPYYIWLGRPLSCNMSHALAKFDLSTDRPLATIDEHTQKPHALNSCHYAIGKPSRLPFYEQKVHDDFRTYIYSFTWEDPVVDMQYLNLTPEDSMLVITSAGDNALHYAIHGAPRNIHCVDMNPSQNHLLELKLAALQSPMMTHDIFFSMFGAGKYSNFIDLLDSELSPYLSSTAFAFWRQKCRNAFTKGFYTQGYTGSALRIAQTLLYLSGRAQAVKRFCESDITIDEQVDIWNTRLRPIVLNPWILGKLFESGLLCWNALGVPKNQLNMVQEEGTCSDFIRDTFDPLVKTWTMKDNYFYLLTLQGHYTKESCPSYLTKEGFEALRADGGKSLDSFRLHTDSITNVLRKMQPSTLTKAVIMDHLDWFTPDLQNPDVGEEVSLFHSRMKVGGEVYWRSASKAPWYAKVFENEGFKVERLGVRERGKAIDRVNMYASFWRAVKV